jgi:peptidoglycan-associated lipoprotein
MHATTNSRTIARHISLLIFAALLAACATEKEKPVVPEPAQPAPAQPAPVVATPAPQPPVEQNPLHDPKNILYKRSVYFAYDKYEVTGEYRPLVEAHAKYLNDHGGAKVAIQGNCDERGSREYNLALGQRRADAVGKIMTLLGVPSRQIETVSFGEEKPRALGHDEASWAENRRSDIVYEREN